MTDESKPCPLCGVDAWDTERWYLRAKALEEANALLLEVAEWGLEVAETKVREEFQYTNGLEANLTYLQPYRDMIAKAKEALTDE